MKFTLAPLCVLPLLLSLSAPALADVFTGRLVDKSGVGLVGIDIDAIDANGNPVTLSGDYTDANGNFTVTMLTGPGVFTILFNPPAPPANTYVLEGLPNVNVSGTTNLGTVTMRDGVIISGRVVTVAGDRVALVDLDALDANGDSVFLSGDQTSATGKFSIVVPKGRNTIRFDPSNASIQVLAPYAIERFFGNDNALGKITLEPGFTVTAVIRDFNFAAVASADLDAHDSVTGDKLYTPGDNTDNNGYVDFVVPAGTYDIEVGPLLQDRLVTKEVLGLAVSSDTSLGIVKLEAGAVLSGNITSVAGSGLFKVDLDLRDPITQASIPVTQDNTDAQGNYAVVVPFANLDLIFTPNYSIPHATELVPGVLVVGDTTIDATLPDCECLTPMGSGTRGTGGLLPKLLSNKTALRTGNPNLRLKIRNARGGATALVAMGVAYDMGIGSGSGSHQPFGSLHRLFAPPIPLALGGLAGVAGAGTGSIRFALPEDPAIAGLTIAAQAAIRDPDALGGYAKTRVLGGVACN